MSLEYPFWVNNFDRVKDHKLKYPLSSKIFEHPVSFWYGERNGKCIGTEFLILQVGIEWS